MIQPIWIDLLDQSMYAPLKTTMMYGAAKLGYIGSVWDNYFSYPNFSYNELLNPQTAINQVASKINGNSNGFWGNFSWGGAGSTSVGTSTNPFNFKFDFSGLNGGTGSGSAGGGKSIEATKIDAYKNVYNKILQNGYLEDDEIKAYQEAMKKSNNSEKLEALRNLFKNISKKNIVAAILDDDNIKKELTKAGYFYSVDNKRKDVDIDEGTKKLIEGIKIESSDGGNFVSLASLCRQNNNIIEVLSYWNESNKTDDDRCILRYISKNMKSTTPAGIQNFVLALLDVAGGSDFKDCPTVLKKKAALSDAYDEHLKPVMDKLKEGTEPSSDIKSKISSALNKVIPAFEDLYTQIRMQQAANIDNTIQEKYGKEFNSLIPDLISETKIQDETKKDLIKEGFEGQIPKADKVENNSRYEKEEKKEKKNYSSVEERIESLTDDGTIKETDSSKSGAYGDVKVYKSKGKDIKGRPQFFIVKDGELVKLKGWLDTNKKLHLSDGSTVDFDKIESKHYTTIEDDEILTTNKKEEKIEEEKEEKEEKTSSAKSETNENITKLVDGKVLQETDNDGVYYSSKFNNYYKVGSDGKLHKYDKKNNKIGEKANIDAMMKKVESKSYQNGKDLVNLIKKDNDATLDYPIVNKYLENVDPDNVMEFLKGVYEVKGLNPIEGIIEHLDDEYDGGIITMDNKKNLIKSLLKVAEDNGFENDADYIKIKTIIDLYDDENNPLSKETTFNNGNHRQFFSWSNGAYAGAGAAAGVGAGIALASNPVGWIIGGIGLLGAGIGYAYNAICAFSPFPYL